MSNFGSAKMIANLPMHPGLSVNEINRLCRTKQLYGFKLKDRPFEPWIIPAESFALYLKYHPTLMNAFFDMSVEDIGHFDDNMIDYYSWIHNGIRRKCPEYTYTISELAPIFTRSIGYTYEMFLKTNWLSIFKPTFLKAKKAIPIIDIVKYLCIDPETLKALRFHHVIVLEDKKYHLERDIRYILMAHMYYTTYGHFN